MRERQRLPGGGLDVEFRAERNILGGLLAASSMALCVFACSTGDPAAPVSGAEVQTTPTYHRDVAPILEKSCIKCHHEGGVGPFSLTTYELASRMAPAMVTEVSARRMPPWGAQDSVECQPPLPWHDDERLTDAEILTLQRWAAGGSPKGDPADAPLTQPVQSLNLVTPTLELEPLTEFQPAASTSDQFRCFVLDAPAIDAGGFVSAINVVPGNPAVVHHVSVFADVGGIAAKRAGPDGSFDCTSKSMTSGGSVTAAVDGESPKATWLLAWAPGGRPLQLPPNWGINVPPHSKVIMEVHYSAGGKVSAPDRTRVQMVMAPAKPEYVVSSWGIGNYEHLDPNGDGLLPDVDGVAEFTIPAGARDHVETMQGTCGVPGPLPIFGLRAHAHLAAIDLKVDIVRNGATTCMLQDRWDFHWQRVYTYDAPIEQLPTLHAGDKVRVRCTYDNSMMNKRLGNELWSRGLQPMDITIGDESLDEMCMVELLYVQKAE